jgi:hypothetical protein
MRSIRAQSSGLTRGPTLDAKQRSLRVKRYGH